MKPPTFSSLKDKIIYPTATPSASKDVGMMDVLAGLQTQAAIASLHKRERTERRILIGIMFVITSIIIAIFVASMATYVILWNIRHKPPVRSIHLPSSASPLTASLISGKLVSLHDPIKMRFTTATLRSNWTDALSLDQKESPVIMLSTGKSLNSASVNVTQFRSHPALGRGNGSGMANSTSPSMASTVDSFSLNSQSPLDKPVTTSPPPPTTFASANFSSTKQGTSNFTGRSFSNDTSIRVGREDESVNSTPNDEAAAKVASSTGDSVTPDAHRLGDSKRARTRVISHLTTSSPPTIKSVTTSSTSQPSSSSSSSLFGLMSRRGYSLESPFVTSTLSLPSARRGSTSSITATSTTTSTGSFVPSVNQWSLESPTQMISYARNWLQSIQRAAFGL